MPLIKTINNITPKILEGVFLADNAVIIGDVIIGKKSSVWFNAVVRGDVNSIVIGDSVNIQDGVVVHCTYKKTKTIIGDNVSIGHNAIIHGCEIKNNVFNRYGSNNYGRCCNRRKFYYCSWSHTDKGNLC